MGEMSKEQRVYRASPRNQMSNKKITRVMPNYELGGPKMMYAEDAVAKNEACG